MAGSRFSALLRPTGFRFLWMVLAVVTVMLSGLAPAHAVPELKKGVNLANWLQLSGKHQITASDLRMLKMNGFDHVRLAVDPLFLGWHKDGDTSRGLPSTEKLDAALALISGAGLNVILDMHIYTPYTHSLEGKPELEDDIVALWAWMADHYKMLDHNRVAYELLNEPDYYNLTPRWQAFGERLVRTVRQVDPERLLLLSGNRGGGIEGLTLMKPVQDDKVYYTFHYYTPYILTHQGASWMQGRGAILQKITNVPYPPPAAPASQIKVAADASPSAARAAIDQYLGEGWGADKVAADIRKVVDWSRSHPVNGKPAPVICTEFGAIKANAIPEARTAWMTDVVAALEDNKIGWSVWEYADVFAISETKGTVRYLSPEVSMALRLSFQ